MDKKSMVVKIKASFDEELLNEDLEEYFGEIELSDDDLVFNLDTDENIIIVGYTTKDNLVGVFVLDLGKYFHYEIVR